MSQNCREVNDLISKVDSLRRGFVRLGKTLILCAALRYAQACGSKERLFPSTYGTAKAVPFRNSVLKSSFLAASEGVP
jgi:hypothetical protein